MVRAIAVVLAALPLAGCREESYELEVANRGGLDARVTVVYAAETRVDRILVSPGETVNVRYSDLPLNVRIKRIIDGTVLYEEQLSGRDFDDGHGRVEIVVYP